LTKGAFLDFMADNRWSSSIMKFFAYLFVIASTLHPLLPRAAETANARIWCFSLRFQQGTDDLGLDTLDLTTISSGVNGELAPYRGVMYVSTFLLDDSTSLGLAINGTMYLNLPPVADANGNGFNDFFESALGISGTSAGTYTTFLGNGTVNATWSRTVGSKDGTCKLHLVDNMFGDLGFFTHQFELIEYSGPLVYSPGTNTVSGNVNLVKTGDSTSQLSGPIQFIKVLTNRFNQLTLQPGSWTNSFAQTLTYTNNSFLREPPWTTNYYGLVQFADGDPNTGEPDYLIWGLSIDDPNDANHNGIPDFSDDPQVAPPPRAPSLGLILTSTNVLISINGDIGHVHDIQQTLALPSTNWQTVASITLTNSPVAVPINLPPTQAAFWRVVAH
jgi:hypothetical protein